MTLFQNVDDNRKTAVKAPVSVKVSVLRMDRAAPQNRQLDMWQSDLLERA